MASNGNDASPGTRSAPVASLQRAIDLAEAGPGRVFAWAEAFTSATLSLPAGVSIFGGLQCQNDWAWVGDVASTQTQSPGTGIRISGEGAARLQDLRIQATARTEAGASAIGVLVVSGDAELGRCSVDSDAGRNGVAATALTASAGDGPTGNDGLSSVACGSVNANTYGPETPNPTCPASVGGRGGNGGKQAPADYNGFAGQKGAPSPRGGSGGMASSPSGVTGA